MISGFFPIYESLMLSETSFTQEKQIQSKNRQALIDTRKGQTLLNLAQSSPSPSRLLHQAQVILDAIDLENAGPRRLLTVKLAQSRVALGLREYDFAALLAIEAFPLMQQIKSVLFLP